MKYSPVANTLKLIGGKWKIMILDSLLSKHMRFGELKRSLNGITSQMLSKLQGMSPEDSLPSWWMNKIAIAANSMNKLRDYLLVPSTNEAKEIPAIDKDNAPGVKIAKIRLIQFY